MFSFAIFYATMGIPLGYLADRKRRTWLVAAGVAVWSLATAASGLAKGFWHLFIARMTVGAGEATLSPCAMSMISDSFPREKRGKPIAFYTAALSLGAGIASLISAAVLTWAKSVPEISLPIVGAVAPWQFTFIIVGLPGILLAAVFLTMREPVRRTPPARGKQIRRHLHACLGERNIYISFVIFVCMMTIVAYSQGWAAPMFKRTWGWEAETYALVNGTVLLIVGPLTVNIAGWANDHFYSKGIKDAPLLIVIIGACIIVPTGVLAPLMPNPVLAMAVYGVNTIGIAMTSATSVTALLQITPGQIRGQTVALYYMTISMAGLFLGPSAVACCPTTCSVTRTSITPSPPCRSYSASRSSCLFPTRGAFTARNSGGRRRLVTDIKRFYLSGTTGQLHGRTLLAREPNDNPTLLLLHTRRLRAGCISRAPCRS